MTKTALANKEIASKEKMQDKELEFRRKENRKDRTMKYITGIAGGLTKGVGGGLISKLIPQRQDPIWYKNYIKDLDQFTRVPTYYRAGSSKLIGGRFAPAIMVGHYYQTTGANTGVDGKTNSSPINQILMRLKEQVLKLNSRSSVEWEAGDIGYNIFASNSIIILINEGERALKIAQTFKGENGYFPSDILAALGWDSAAVQANLADFRKYLSLLKTRFNSAIVAPADLSLFKRSAYLSSNIFADNDGSPCQYYAYKTSNYFQLTKDEETVSSLAVPELFTPITWYNIVSGMIQAIAESPNFVTMYADLRSAFGANLYQFDTAVDNSAEIVPVYHESIREEIANSYTLPGVLYAGNVSTARVKSGTLTYEAALIIKQNDEGFIYQGSATDTNLQAGMAAVPIEGHDATGFAYGVNLIYGRDNPHFYNVHKDNVSGDDILDLTRFNLVLSVTSPAGQDSQQFNLVSYGTEILSHYTIHRRFNSGGMQKRTFCTYVHCGFYWEEDGIMDSIVEYNWLISMLHAFDWCPLFMTSTVNSLPVDSEGSLNLDVHTEIRRPFTIDGLNLIHLNSACVLSELYVNTAEFKRY